MRDLPDYGRELSQEDHDFDLFSIEDKRERLYKPGGFFDENPTSGPLVNRTVL